MSDDWQPPPGMTKRVCASCDRSFATATRAAICPTCKGSPRSSGVGELRAGTGGYQKSSRVPRT